MVRLLKRQQVRVLLAVGHSQAEVTMVAGESLRSVRRIATESAVQHVDDGQERARRRICRPSRAEPFRRFVAEVLAKEPDLSAVEILRRAKSEGYRGAKTG